VRFGGLAVVLALTAASAAFAAPGTGTSSRDATNQQLDTRTHQALLSLYALDSQLQSWRAQLGSLERAAAALRRQRWPFTLVWEYKKWGRHARCRDDRFEGPSIGNIRPCISEQD